MSQGLPVFQAPYYQRGHGLGAVLGILRGAIPFLKPVFKSLGKSALRAGVNVATDVLDGQKVGSSLKRRTVEEVKRRVNQKGSGMRRRRIPVRRPRAKVIPRSRGRKPKAIKRRKPAKKLISTRAFKRQRLHRDIFS